MMKCGTAVVAVIAISSVSVLVSRVVATDTAEMACGQPVEDRTPAVQGGKHPRVLPPPPQGRMGVEGRQGRDHGGDEPVVLRGRA